MRRVMAFNWPKLLVGAAAAVATEATAMGAGSWPGRWPGAWLATWLAACSAARLGLMAIALGSAYLVITSLAVSWWVYDRSDLHEWSWLRSSLPPAARRWALVHAGLDEAGPALPAVLGPPVAVIDISSGLARTSPSLRRAQRRAAGGGVAPALEIRSDCPQLPLRPGGLDAMVLVFAAHEVRDRRQRDRLFGELQQALTPGGRVVLVEHLRDGPNMVAFGPAAWHFQTRRTWARVAQRAGLGVIREVRKTPFVRGMALCRS